MSPTARPLDDDVRTAYLARLGLDPEPPSVDALVRLHTRHVERVPYETLWINAGEGWDVDPHAAADRVARSGRGGYCYHLNGAFALLLASLCYDVRRHTGGVHGPEGPNSEALGNHLVLTVAGLPTDDHPDGTWYVDLGLGDALHAPLPLRPATVRQGCFELTLARADGVGDWHLAHDPAGGFRGMAWSSGPADDDLHARTHVRLSTSPESGFVKIPVAQTRQADHVEVVRGLLPIRVDGSGTTTGEPLTDRRDWFDALADRFGLTFEGLSDDARDRLWDRTLGAHRQWEAEGRP